MKTSIFKQVGTAFLYLAFAKALLISTSCKSDTVQLEKVIANQTVVDSTIQEQQDIVEFIAPYKKSVDAQMDEELSYNVSNMHKNDYRYNTPLGNMMATIVRTQGEPVFTSRTGEKVDVVLLNHGGMRAPLPEGAVTMRRAYEIMPFENNMVVAQLNGTQMQQLVNYLVSRRKAHPFDGLQITLNSDNTLASALLNGEPIDYTKSFNVITNDYLYNGGDNMSFFKDAPITRLDYKIRNAMIDYFKKVDTLKFERDNRFEVKSNS